MIHYYECHVSIVRPTGMTVEDIAISANHCGFKLSEVNGNTVATARTKTKARAMRMIRWLSGEFVTRRAKIEAIVFDTGCGDTMPSDIPYHK